MIARDTRFLVVFAAACACSNDGGRGSTPPDSPGAGSDCVWLGRMEYRETASCRAGTALTTIEARSNGYTSHSMCYAVVAQSSAVCASGCAVQSQMTLEWSYDARDLYQLGHAAPVLCAETPEKRAGDPCDLLGTNPCWPTRARVNADGTVAGQDYLQCNAGACAPTAAPVVSGYLAPCSAPHQEAAGVNGVVVNAVDGCLLAWDATTQTVFTGATRVCIGDWQCPAGSLCDDQVTNLAGGGTPIGVCKPGPRGVLTPAMLSP
jgi:hypothetical protein